MASAMAAPAIERRRAPRRRTLKSGIVIYGGYLFVLYCSVRDLSTEGARLRFVIGTPVPRRFVLMFPSDSIVFEATVVRRRGNEVGVHFESKGIPVQEADQRVKCFHFR
jgi:hypothetical protein